MRASSGEREIVALASGETKQFKLALIRLCVHLRLFGCMSQPDVSFDTVTKHARRAFQLFARDDGRSHLADRMQRGEQPPLGLFYFLFAPVRAAFRRRFRRWPREQNPQSGERPEQSRRDCFEHQMRAVCARSRVQKIADGEGRSGCQIDRDGFAQTHGDRRKGNACANAVGNSKAV